jgi:hypothetical protein
MFTTRLAYAVNALLAYLTPYCRWSGILGQVWPIKVLFDAISSVNEK